MSYSRLRAKFAASGANFKEKVLNNNLETGIEINSATEGTEETKQKSTEVMPSPQSEFTWEPMPGGRLKQAGKEQLSSSRY